MRRLSAAFFSVTLLAGPALAESPDTNVLRMLDQVMIIRSVAAKCTPPNQASAIAFQRRYQDVATQAQTALKALASDLTQAHIESVMAEHYDEIDRRVAAVVAQESCDGPHIKEALQKYDGIVKAVMTPQVANKAD